MAAEKQPNYTADMVKTATEMYADLGNAGVDAIAEAINRPRRSVIAKLVREGVYVADVKAPKAAKDEGPTKKEMLIELAKLVTFDVEGLTGATKPALTALIAFAQSVRDADESDDEAAA